MYIFQFKSGQQLTELAVANMVDKYRDEQNFSRGASFKSIVGYGPNGAIPHYTPSISSSLKLDHISTLVIDSGAHYWGESDVKHNYMFDKHPSMILNMIELIYLYTSCVCVLSLLYIKINIIKVGMMYVYSEIIIM